MVETAAELLRLPVEFNSQSNIHIIDYELLSLLELKTTEADLHMSRR